MGVELHGVAHDVRHLVVASVVHALHRVQDAPLYGFQSILDVWHGTFQDHVGGIVQKPALVHAAEVVDSSSVEAVHWFIVRVALSGTLFFVLCTVLTVGRVLFLYFVASYFGRLVLAAVFSCFVVHIYM